MKNTAGSLRPTTQSKRHVPSHWIAHVVRCNGRYIAGRSGRIALGPSQLEQFSNAAFAATRSSQRYTSASNRAQACRLRTSRRRATRSICRL